MYQVRCTLIITNRPFDELRKVIPNAACVLPLIDHLVHNATIIAIAGNTYRLEAAGERTEQHARLHGGGKT